VAKLPDIAVDVLGQDGLDRGVGGVVERGEDGFGAVTRDGEATAVVGVTLSERFGERGGLLRGRGEREVVDAVVGEWQAFRLQSHASEDFIGFGVSEEIDRNNATGNGSRWTQ
jgi:hypothetical protein